MTNFGDTRFTKIKNLSDKRRLPRLGKIYLGFKDSGKGFPVELPFFRLPEEVAKVYGFKSADEALRRAADMGCTRDMVLKYIADHYDTLTESLNIYLPLEDENAVFPQSYIWYGSQAGAKCRGNGEIAIRGNEDGTISEIDCPCDNLKSEDNPKGECTQRARLMFVIPEINMGGVYQLSLSSINSIIAINSGIHVTKSALRRIAMIKHTLRRIPIETHFNQQKQIHFVCLLTHQVPEHEIENFRKDTSRMIIQTQNLMIEHVEDLNPAFDEDVLEAEVENVPEPEPAIAPQTASDAPESKNEGEGVSVDGLKALISKSASLGALKQSWQIVQGIKGLSKEDSATLNKLKNARKKELEAQEKSSAVNLEDLDLALRSSESLEELEKIWSRAEPLLKGEDKVHMMRIHDRRKVELEKIVPRETTKQEPF